MTEAGWRLVSIQPAPTHEHHDIRSRSENIIQYNLNLCVNLWVSLCVFDTGSENKTMFLPVTLVDSLRRGKPIFSLSTVWLADLLMILR